MKRLNWSLGPQATANFGLVLVVLVFNSVVVHRNTIALNRAQESINHTYEVFLSSQAVFSSLTDAESDVRGYVVTGDESRLQNYRRQAETIPDQIRQSA